MVALGIALILGNNLPDTDDWTESLITNDEVLAIDQDPLALGAKRVSQAGGSEVWVKPMKDGSKAIGLFNRGDAPGTAALDWTAAGLAGSQRLRDVWQHGDLGMFQGTFSSPGTGAWGGAGGGAGGATWRTLRAGASKLPVDPCANALQGGGFVPVVDEVVVAVGEAVALL